ncbi:MAG: deaminase [Ilumatobacteraceae bacterium]|nr:deaminase [Ilumatobacteraceae bacterium]
MTPESFASLDPGMRAALEQAWESTRAGSLGIGAAAGRDGELLAVGRNRIHETDPGDDVLAGTSLAHAELNVLAKLPFRAHDGLQLHTTLQPCVQCLGAIRLSSVEWVQVLAPDPLFRGIERMRELTPYLARRWPTIEQRPVDEWAVLALLGPTRHTAPHPTLGEAWVSVLPGIAELVAEVDASGVLDDARTVVEAADRVWDRLGECVDEVAALAADDDARDGGRSAQ